MLDLYSLGGLKQFIRCSLCYYLCPGGQSAVRCARA